MFKLALNPTYSWPVSVEVPTDGGKYEEATFQAVFKRGTVTDYQELHKRMDSGEINFMDEARSVLVGWDEVVGEGGQPVEFSEVSREQLLQIPRFAEAIFWAYVRSATGAKVKN